MRVGVLGANFSMCFLRGLLTFATFVLANGAGELRTGLTGDKGNVGAIGIGVDAITASSTCVFVVDLVAALVVAGSFADGCEIGIEAAVWDLGAAAIVDILSRIELRARLQ